LLQVSVLCRRNINKYVSQLKLMATQDTKGRNYSKKTGSVNVTLGRVRVTVVVVQNK
jgi:hypothetical protein